MKIVLDDLSGKDIEAFLAEHMADMRAAAPPESMHALEMESLKCPEITFWSVYLEGQIVGCGAIKELNEWHGEIKSMRTAESVRGRGIASNLLLRILVIAKSKGYSRVSLETGSDGCFKPARNLYARHGFQFCPPFSSYREDPNSVFMSRGL